ncbi:MAG: DUF4232 domain-containing protein [Acidimicrobiales bacterium]
MDISRRQTTVKAKRDSRGSVLGTSVVVVLVALVAAGTTAYFLVPARSTRTRPNHPVTTSTLQSGKTRKNQSTSQSSTTTTSSSSGSTGNGGSGTGVSHTLTRCTAAQLAASHTSAKSAAGTVGEGFTLKNVSSTTCTVDGYPDIQLYNSSGNAMATTTIRNGSSGFTAQTPAALTVSPGSEASFNIGFSGASSSPSSGTCSSSSQIAIALPQGTFHYPSLLTVNDSIDPCNGGTLYVSAFYSGPSTL